MKIYLIILLLLFPGCRSSQKISTMVNPQPVEIKIVDLDSKVNIEISNNSGDTIIILNPQKFSIQKFENNTWQYLKILACPCDAPCNAPKESNIIPANQTFTITWDKKERWCGNRTPGGIRETKEATVSQGKYKITISIEVNDEPQSLIKEFEIN